LVIQQHRHRQRRRCKGILLILEIARIELIQMYLCQITMKISSDDLQFFLLLCGGRKNVVTLGALYPLVLQIHFPVVPSTFSTKERK
jgi:hypothetical protein